MYSNNFYSDNYNYANGAPFISSNYGNLNVAAYLPTHTGNISAAGIVTTGNITITDSNYLIANLITSFAGTNGDIVIDPDGLGNVIFPQNTEVYIQSTAVSNAYTNGALIVSGGVGVTGNVNASGVYAANIGYNDNSGTRKVYQFYNAATNSLDTVFG